MDVLENDDLYECIYTFKFNMSESLLSDSHGINGCVNEMEKISNAWVECQLNFTILQAYYYYILMLFW